MCDPHPAWMRLRNMLKDENRYLQDDFLKNSRLQINSYPQVYLQVVFEYFRPILQGNPNFVATLADFLQNFGWLPERLYHLQPQERNQELYRLYEIFRFNAFYGTTVLRPDQIDTPLVPQYVHLRAKQQLQLPQGIPVYEYQGPGKKGKTKQNWCSIRYGDMYNVLLARANEYVPVPGLPTEQEAAGARRVFQTRFSFATTLYQAYEAQIGQESAIARLKRNFGTGIQRLTEEAITALEQTRANLQEDDLNDLLKFSLGLLLRFPTLVNRDVPDQGQGLQLRTECNDFLKRLGLYPRTWPPFNISLSPEDQATLIAYFREPVDRSLLPLSWIVFMRRLSILPDPDSPNQVLTNGMLINLLVQSMGLHALREPPRVGVQVQPQAAPVQDQQQERTPIDVRNQMIWFVALAPSLFKLVHYKLVETGFVLQPQDANGEARQATPSTYGWYPQGPMNP